MTILIPKKYNFQYTYQKKDHIKYVTIYYSMLKYCTTIIRFNNITFWD